MHHTENKKHNIGDLSNLQLDLMWHLTCNNSLIKKFLKNKCITQHPTNELLKVLPLHE